jgi:glycosyltransferase involved in cell wall biosynthesis
MKIAWVIYGELAQATGGYVYDRIVIERLRARGDEVRVVSLAPAPRSRAVAALSLAARLARARPEVVVGDELCYREIAPAFALVPRSAARVLLVHHLSQWERAPGIGRALTALAESAAIRAADACIATSATTAERLRREHGLAEVHVAEPGADRLPRRARPARPGGALRLTFVGSFTPRKRLLELLDAFEHAGAAYPGAPHTHAPHPGAPHVELVLIGDPARDPAYAARVRRAIAGSPMLRARVSVRGLVSDGALAGALAETDALVLSSSLEGYGMVLTEAIHAGVPVIATRGGAVAEVVQDGAEALLCDTTHALGEALRRFLGDASLRERMRAAAEARAPSLPTWDQMAEAVRAALLHAALMRAAVSRPPARRPGRAGAR